jgi:ferredoxin-thioredoxin reductase catalytic subunit
MGKLFDIMKKKQSEEQSIQQEEPKQEIGQQKYTRAWASRVALHQGFELNTDDKKVDGILAALNRKDGQCPCGGNGAQFKCPCVIMRTKGICKCGLYKTIEDRKVTSAQSTAKIKTDNE